MTQTKDQCWLRLDNGETVWPNPYDPNDVEWRLRHGEPSRSDRMVAASVMAAYRQLVTDTQARRNDVVKQIRAALLAMLPPAERVSKGETR